MTAARADLPSPDDEHELEQLGALTDLAGAVAQTAARSATVATSDAVRPADPADPAADENADIADAVQARRWRSSWTALAVSTLARVVLTMLASLLLCSLVPVLFGWHSTVVMTGSMQPRLHVGDIAVARPVPVGELRIGQVLLVADPDHPDRLRLHRLAAFRADGTLTLRGDANPANDSSPVARSAVRGVGALRVPYLGRPELWVQERNFAALAVLSLALVVVVAAAFAYRGGDDDTAPSGPSGDDPSGDDPSGDDPSGDDPSGDEPSARNDESGGDAPGARPARHRRPREPVAGRVMKKRIATAGAVIVAVLAGTLATAGTAVAATRFSRTASNAADSWAAAPYFTCSSAVSAANPYFFYELDETKKNKPAADSSGNGRDGTFGGGITYSGTGACDRDSTNRAVTLDGSTGYVTTPTTVANPSVFTEEIWFKTTTTRGGKLIGFGSSRTGASSSYDRHIYLANSGQLVFGVHPGAVKTVVSPGSYNDGSWHLADATLSNAGMKLYVDGDLVAGDASVTTAENYTGYWRIGYDNLSGWGTTTPTSYYVAATLDDAAVYTTALTTSQIAGHYAAA